MPPPWLSPKSEVDWLPVMVQPLTDRVGPKLPMPPPRAKPMPVALLPETRQLTSDSEPKLQIPPPSATSVAEAVLPETRQLTSDSELSLSLKMPPPSTNWPVAVLLETTSLRSARLPSLSMAPPPKWLSSVVRLPSVIVSPQMVALTPGLIRKTWWALPPLTLMTSDPGPWMLTLLATVSTADGVMVPLRPGANTMVSLVPNDLV